MSNWKIATISAISAVVASGFTFAGGYWGLQSTIEEQLTDHRELDIKMVDVALAILAGEKGSKPENQSVEARRFAVQILRQYSKLDESKSDVKSINWDEWAEAVDKPLQFEPSSSLSYGWWGYEPYTKDQKECLRLTQGSIACLPSSLRKPYIPDGVFEIVPPGLDQNKAN